jgi:hypothetical protein
MITAAGNQCYYGSEYTCNVKTRQMNTMSKIKIYKTIVKPVVTYGYETWSMTEMDKVMLIAHVQTSN